MAYSIKSPKNGKTYFLHSKTTKTPSGERTLYYFAGEAGVGALDSVPDGYEVFATEERALPVLKKKK
jgi:hypothetical protein